MEGSVHAVGIDLAWGHNPTGVAHMVGTPPSDDGVRSWRLLEVRTLPNVEAVAAWVASRVPVEAPVWVAVDAPLIATNPEGTQRNADQALSNAFRRFRVSCLPVDIRHADRGSELRRELREENIDYALPGSSAEVRRGVFETFPTAAQLSFFDLTRPLQYKRGTVDRRQEGLRSLQLRIAMMEDAALRLDDTGPLKRLLSTDPYTLNGARLKQLEDELDALLCALVAALAWSAPARLLTYGDLDRGAIVVPHPPVTF